MSTRKQRIRRVGYADDIAGTNQAWITGNIHTNNSTITVDNTKNQTPKGQSYGGSMVSCDIRFEDHQDYSTIEGFMLANTEKYWFFEYADGHIYVTQDSVNPFVKLVPGIDSREGNEPWALDFELYGGVPMLAAEEE